MTETKQDKKARRGKGEGAICKRKSGGYAGQFDLGVDARTGKRQRITVYGKTKTDVGKKLAELAHQKRTGTLVRPTTHQPTDPASETKVITGGSTLQEYLDYWIATHRAFGRRERTVENYQFLSEAYIIPRLGNMQLKDIQPAHVRALHTALAQQHRKSRRSDKPTRNAKSVQEPKKLSPNTVRGVRRVLHAAFNQAVDEEILVQNPVSKAKIPDTDEKPFNVMTEAEARAFLDKAKAHRLYPLFLVAIYTGMRQGELLGLTWRHVDLTNAVIHVRQALQRRRKKEDSAKLKEPKTRAGRRPIDIPKSVVKALLQHRVTQDAERDLAGALYEDRDLVFASPLGVALNGSSVNKQFQRILEREGMQKLRFHDLRHTHATLLLMAGVNIKVVSERLGHKDVTTTLKIYSHVLPSMQKGAAEKMDTLLAAPPDETPQK